MDFLRIRILHNCIATICTAIVSSAPFVVPAAHDGWAMATKTIAHRGTLFFYRGGKFP